jgi:hypothetical protein
MEAEDNIETAKRNNNQLDLLTIPKQQSAIQKTFYSLHLLKSSRKK